MKNEFRVISALRTFAAFAVSILFAAAGDAFAQSIVTNFSLRNVDGKSTLLADYPDAKGFIVVFTCNHCPFAKLYPERLNDLAKKYTSKGVPLLAISSTDTVQYEEDGFVEMVKLAKQGKYKYPYLQDADQSVAKSFHAQKTPHAFVIWK